MQFRFSLVLSYILHPIFIPVLSTVVVMTVPEFNTPVFDSKLKAQMLSLVIAFSILIPVSTSLLLIKLKVIDTMKMESREHRNIPLLITSISYLAMLYLLKKTGTPPVFLYMLYTALFASLVGLIVNLFYKISLHTLGWGALAASFAGLMNQVGVNLIAALVGAILLAGFAAYARLKEKSHSNMQVYLGFLVGYCMIILLMLIV